MRIQQNVVPKHSHVRTTLFTIAAPPSLIRPTYKQSKHKIQLLKRNELASRRTGNKQDDLCIPSAHSSTTQRPRRIPSEGSQAVCQQCTCSYCCSSSFAFGIRVFRSKKEAGSYRPLPAVPKKNSTGWSIHPAGEKIRPY